MFKVLIADKISDHGIEILQKEYLLEVHNLVGLSPELLLESIADYDALLVRSRTKVTSDVIESGKRLKVIGRAGIGLDNIDTEAAKLAGIRVLNVGNESVISVAEHTIGMIFSLARRIPQAHNSLRERLWHREKFMGVEVHNKVLGVIGLGNIGYEVALRAKALGMQVIAYDPYCLESRKNTFELVPLDTLLEASDFITIHVPKNKETIDLISYRELCRCKKGVRIINISRGGIVNEMALVRAIRERIVAGAALDVFENEPNVDEMLLEMNEIIATPHIAANTEDAQIKIAVALAHNIVALFKQFEHRIAS